jgi:hypothetical protein
VHLYAISVNSYTCHIPRRLSLVATGCEIPVMVIQLLQEKEKTIKYKENGKTRAEREKGRNKFCGVSLISSSLFLHLEYVINRKDMKSVDGAEVVSS